MVNNFNRISELLVFENQGDFYHIQIIQRKKDNPNLSKSTKIIKTYNVYSVYELTNLKETIINLCDEKNARAYIRVNKRNDQVVALEMLERLANAIKTGSYATARVVYDKAIGNTTAVDKNTKRWLIDVDIDGEFDADMIAEEVDKRCTLINQLRPEGKKIINILPTKHGAHIITRPFDVKAYCDAGYQKEEIGKDSPTILYFN